MVNTFETLSGSITFKEQYDDLTFQVSEAEKKVREISDSLRDKRHEKIRTKGLAEYKQHLDGVIKEQSELR
jgi:hypothetical protein